MKKKILCILTFITAMTLSSCGNPNKGTSESEKESESNIQTTYYSNGMDNAVNTTIAELLKFGDLNGAKGSTTVKSDTVYRITGTVQSPSNYTYGNFDITDETGSILVWGLSANYTSLKENNGKYTYTNDQSFSKLSLKAGDVITIEGLYMAYIYSSGYFKPEFSGYILRKQTGYVEEIEGKNYTTQETYTGNYYDSVNNKKGNELLSGLHSLMLSTHKTYVTYDSLKSTLKSTDPYGTTGNAKCFYTGKNASSFSREHVWCQSLSGSTSSSSTNLYGTTYGGSDIHHIRPVITSYNSQRSNAAFGIIYGPKEGMDYIPYENGQKSYLTGSVFEPADIIKGDVARIVMYMYMHYSSQINNDSSTYNFLGIMNIDFIMGPTSEEAWKVLRLWNANDPVSEDEKIRNEKAFQIQGNRNPFIDHPSYADAIWG